MATSGEKEKVGNPLEIAEVLEQVLNYVPLGDLKNAREVAKLWRDESLDNFRNSIVYVLDPDTEALRFLRLSLNIEANGGGSETMSGDNASSFPPSSPSGMYKFQEKPIKKYRLTGPQEITPDGFNSLALGPMCYFWNQCGPNLTYLDLKGQTYLFKSSFIEALISFFKLCPNLEELRFSPVWGVDHDPLSMISEACRVHFDREFWHPDDGNDYESVDSEGEDDVNEDRGEELFDRVFIMHETRGSMYDVLRISKTQLANMQESLALKMKSLSIELTGPYETYRGKYIYSRLWRCVFNLMPNLKKLSLDGQQYVYVMEALCRKTLTTNQMIQLDSFEYNGEKSRPSDFDFNLAYLWYYLNNLRNVVSPAPLKNLKLMKIPFRELWQCPTTTWNILFHIRARIECLCIELECHQSQFFNFGPPESYKFDFFNMIFPNLVELALEFDYKSFKSESCNYKSYRRNANEKFFLFFDFSVFRGTPNLKRFKMKTLHVQDRNRVWLKRRLTPKDLQMNRLCQKWYFMNGQGLNPNPRGRVIWDSSVRVILCNMKYAHGGL